MTHKWAMRILKKNFEIKRMFSQSNDQPFRIHAWKRFWSRSGISNVIYIKICQSLSWFQVKRWEQGMRIAKDSFQDFLIYVDAVSSIIFIMKMNAIWILTTKLKRNYQIFIQGRLITWEGIVKKFSNYFRIMRPLRLNSPGSQEKYRIRFKGFKKHDCALSEFKSSSSSLKRLFL